MKIIINADDFGMTKSINKAIVELMQLGTITSTTVMVNMPYVEEAKQLLNIPNVSVGLHFNLTEGRPVSDPDQVKTLVNAEGNFYTKKELESRAKNNQIDKNEVVLELRNQYKKLHGILGNNISHFDSHQGLNRIPVVFKALLDFGKVKDRPARMRFYVKHYIQNNGQVIKPSLLNIPKFGLKRFMVETYLEKNKREINQYFKTPDGMLVSSSHNAIDVFKMLAAHPTAKYKNHIMEIPCHPAVDKSELENTKLTDERIEEYEFLKSPQFVKAAKDIKLVNFKEIGV